MGSRVPNDKRGPNGLLAAGTAGAAISTGFNRPGKTFSNSHSWRRLATPWGVSPDAGKLGLAGKKLLWLTPLLPWVPRSERGPAEESLATRYLGWHPIFNLFWPIFPPFKSFLGRNPLPHFSWEECFSFGWTEVKVALMGGGGSRAGQKLPGWTPPPGCMSPPASATPCSHCSAVSGLGTTCKY